MKIKVLSILILSLLSIYGNAQDLYYYYKGEKVKLEESGTLYYIAYNDTDVELFELVENGANARYVEAKGRGLLQDSYWAIIDENLKIIIEEKTIIPYVTKGCSGIFISNLFSVKLKKNEDVKLLDQISETYNIELVERKEYDIPLVYDFVVNTMDKGTALDIANRIYEDGLFEIVQVDFMERCRTSINEYSCSTSYCLGDIYQSSNYNVVAYFDIPVIVQKVILKVCDSQGRIVLSKNIDERGQFVKVIDVSRLQRGVYSFSLMMNENEIESKKCVIRR